MFSKQIFVVTGGSTGIGQATAALLAEKGAQVYNLDINKPTHSHSLIHYVPCDISVFPEVEKAFQNIISRENKIDLLFANAGIHLFANLEDTSVEDLDRVININLKGIYYALKCTIPVMKRQNSGAIVLTGSDQSLIGKGESSIYGATKAAIAQLTKSTTIDYAKYNIRINCICPGTIETPLYHTAVSAYSSKSGIPREKIYESLKLAQPISRVGTATEVANLVEFLLSEKSSFITGSLFSIDGGFVAQ